MEDSFYSASHWGFDEVYSSDSDSSEKQSSNDSDCNRDSKKKHRRVEKPTKKASSKDRKRKDGKKKREKRHKKHKKRRHKGEPSAEDRAKAFDLLLRGGDCSLAELAKQLRRVVRATARSDMAHDSRAASDILGASFHFAACAGDLDGVQLLLQEGGAPVDWRSPAGDTNGLTALHVACLLCDGPLATLLVKHGADCDLETSSGESAKDMGLDGLLIDYANEVAAWEAKKRAVEREKREAQELAREKALAEAEWKAKIAEASAYDELDCSGAGPAMEQGWDAEEQAVRDAEDRHGDWFAEIANQRRQLRRAAQAAFKQQQQQQQQQQQRGSEAKKSASDTNGPQPTRQHPSHGSSDNFAGFRSGSAGAPPPPPPSSNSSYPQAPLSLSSEEAIAARALDSAAWKQFVELVSKSNNEVLVNERQVPWPSQGDHQPLPGHQDMEPQARKVAVRQLQLRWHIDKFTQKYGRLLSGESGEKDAILRRVVTVSQALNAIIEETSRV